MLQAVWLCHSIIFTVLRSSFTLKTTNLNSTVAIDDTLKNGARFLFHQEYISRYNIDIEFLTLNSTLNAKKKYLSTLKLEEYVKKFLYPPPLTIILTAQRGLRKYTRKCWLMTIIWIKVFKVTRKIWFK